MIRLLLLSILFSTLFNSLHAHLAHPTNIHCNHQIITEPDPNFGYKKVKDKSGYNFEDKDGKRIFSKAVIDGYPLSETYFAIAGKNKKYALVDKEEKYITNKLMPPLVPKSFHIMRSIISSLMPKAKFMFWTIMENTWIPLKMPGLDTICIPEQNILTF